MIPCSDTMRYCPCHPTLSPAVRESVFAGLTAVGSAMLWRLIGCLPDWQLCLGREIGPRQTPAAAQVLECSRRSGGSGP